ncbi:hypothetical protein PoB_004932800 [Plakobranchus ocellatus]|uniref:Uncharacterized protein n=1 Tax=Plakobranchus ocellatus TaxID=259542 RepID=A0AAV4BTA3_9GAST|nr:hypothetical protein PoB_004932800 [Plakobranchus ocellatus]
MTENIIQVLAVSGILAPCSLLKGGGIERASLQLLMRAFVNSKDHNILVSYDVKVFRKYITTSISSSNSSSSSSNSSSSNSSSSSDRKESKINSTRS